MTLKFSRKFKALRQRLASASIASTVVLCSAPLPVAAQQQDWWFDVEVIVFERLHDTPLVEQFESQPDTPGGYAYDLLSQALYPDAQSVLRTLPLCPKEELPSIEAIIAAHRAFLSAQQDASESTDAPDALEPEPTNAEEQGSADSSQSIAVDDQIAVEQESLEAPDETSLDGLTSADETVEIDTEEAELLAPVPPLPRLIAAQQAYIEQLDPLASFEWQRRYDCLEPEDVINAEEFVFLSDMDLFPRVTAMPRNPSGTNWQRNFQPHLLDADQRLLQEFADDIQRQRDKRVLLHTTWRQEVQFGRDVAQSMRLIAGQDFNAALYARWEEAQALAEQEERHREEPADMDFTANGQPAPEGVQESVDETYEDPFFVDLFAAINGPVNPDIVNEILTEENHAIDEAVHLLSPLWQIDGEFKVFLQYIGGVPYLHINNDLRFKQPTQYNQYGEAIAFDNVEMKQLRRVISQQIHYFDHPLFGVIVQIRRYQRPSLLDDELGDVNE